MDNSNNHFILAIRCADRAGIVAAVAPALSNQNVFITESSHYGGPDTGLSFMRTVFRDQRAAFAVNAAAERALQLVAERYCKTMTITSEARAMFTIIAVSKNGHCLNNLLHQWHAGELPINVAAVASNHDDMRRLAEWYGIPYLYLPLEDGHRRAQKGRLLDAIREYQAELTVLARYMQIPSDDLCRALAGCCISIRHSFFPNFEGTKPYHQGHARGVMAIGATANYLTPTLDEGPIVEQETVRVGHGLNPDEFVRIGKDIENVVLARATRRHAQHRGLRNGERTVVFRQAGRADRPYRRQPVFLCCHNPRKLKPCMIFHSTAAPHSWPY